MWEYKHTDELNHANHKYIAKIGEGKNAKYFYTQEALDAYKKGLSKGTDTANKLNTAKTEASRQLDNAKYDTQYKVKEGMHTVNVATQEGIHGEGSRQAVGAFAKGAADLAANRVLKQLNNIGSGQADNKVVEAVDRGKKFFKKLFG